jgi:hypothetical protein
VWLAAWGERDPDQPHTHLGPVAVDVLAKAAASAASSCASTAADSTPPARSATWTDKPENVAFYTRHGYAVLEEADVIGVPNWFMTRQPQRPPQSPPARAA